MCVLGNMFKKISRVGRGFFFCLFFLQKIIITKYIWSHILGLPQTHIFILFGLMLLYPYILIMTFSVDTSYSIQEVCTLKMKDLTRLNGCESKLSFTARKCC